MNNMSLNMRTGELSVNTWEKKSNCRNLFAKVTQIISCKLKSNALHIKVKSKVKVSFIVNSATWYRTYIQRIEIALLSYSLVHTDNTKH